MRISAILLTGIMMFTSIIPVQATTKTNDGDQILPDPVDLQGDYVYYDVLSDEFNGEVKDEWLMDYMPWWSDTAEREQSGTKTRYRFIDADSENNQSLQIYVNGENRMGEKDFQPYYLEKLYGPQSQEAKDRYLADKSQKNTWNSKFVDFMAGGKDYLNTFRGSEAPIENHLNYTDAGATTYGYFEARIKFMSIEKGQGIAPAFWFIGMQDDVYDRAEVDVFEFLDNHTLDFTIHPKGDPNVQYATKEFKFEEDMSQDYHTYGVLWDENGFSLYVDGEFIYRHERKIDYRMIPMFSINHHENGWIGSVDGQDLPEERTMDIDYFRVFKKVGTDPEPNKLPEPEMTPGNNVAEGAYISLFGLTGTEADATPVQWLNDKKTDNTVLSGICDRMGETMEQSTLPQYLYIDWRMPATFDTIILHAQNAKSSAPTLVDVEISKDGENWETIKSDVHLDWKTDSQIAESQVIELDSVQENNLYTRIKIKEANLNAQGRFGLCEVEIGEDIVPMTPEYMPLPDEVDANMKDSLFSTWNLDGDSSSTTEGLGLTCNENNLTYVEGKDGQALQVNGRNQHIYAPLETNDGSQLKCDEDFTLGMWIKPSYTSLSGDEIILAQQTGSQGGRPWLLIYNNNIGTFLGNENTFGNIPLKENEWQYVAVTFHVLDNEKAEIRLYVNGQLDVTKTISYEADSKGNPQLLLGRHKNNEKGFYEGQMDSITLLNKCIQPQDMKALYEANGRVNEVKGQTYDLSKIVELPTIRGNIGELTSDSLSMPEEVTAVFDNVYGQSVKVNWNADDLAKIDFTKADVYTVRGTVDLSAYPQTTNTKQLEAEQKIEIVAPVSLTGLSEALQKVNAVDESKYTEESFKAFLTAVQAAQTKQTQLIIGGYPNYSTPERAPAYATQEIVDGTTAELIAAFDLLVEVEEPSVNVTELENLLSKVDQYNKDDYTKESWDQLIAVVEEAQALLDKEGYTQDEIDQMVNKLEKAISSLENNESEITVDTSDLEALLDNVTDLKSRYYTEDSWSYLETVVHEAEDLLEKENLTQDEVDKLTEKLSKAIRSLEVKQPSDDKDDETNDDSVSTAAEDALINWMALFAIATPASAVLLKRKYNKKTH